MPARLFNYALPPQRIRTFLILFALALTSPLVVLAVFALSQMANLEEREIERRVLQVAQDLAGDVDRELESATVTLETLATSQALAGRDFARFHDQAGRAIRREQAGILVVDDTFQQLLNTRVAFGTELPKTSDTETAQRVFDTKQRQISGLFMGKVSRQPVINVEVPVFDGEDVRLVLIMALDATRFEKMLQSQRLEARWITGITDNKGIIVARSERHADFVGKPLPQELLEQSRTEQGVFRATNVAGQQIVRATVRSQVAGWLVSATVPVADVEASRRRSQAFALAMIATALGLGAALAYMFATFMARPLQAATTCAAAVGRGEDVAPLKSPLVEANALTGVLSSASQELRRRQEHSAFLIRELAHRSKNVLAVVQGMALQTARQTTNVDQFVGEFAQRVDGLAGSLDLMVQQNWQGAWLRDLVSTHLNLFGAGSRTQLDGPALFLSAHAVQNIGFALNELATNASKHGSLTSPQGRVLVSWSRVEGERIRLEWVERDGPAVQSPAHRGFGFLVITELVAQALHGDAKVDFYPEGIQWQLEFPSSHVATAEEINA
jgi:two-component sensor histidine kinase